MMLTAEQRAAIRKAIDSITGDRMDDPMQYCPEQLVFFGFVLGVAFTGVTFILAN